jgi:transcriptional regulator with XRE-family HTH domain
MCNCLDNKIRSATESFQSNCVRKESMEKLIFSIGQRIREFRKEKGMTLVDLAAKINVSAGLVSQLERGGVGISVSLLKSISDSLAIPISTFFEKLDDEVHVHPRVMGKRERKVVVLDGGEGIRFSLICSHADLGSELLFIEYPPGSSTGKDKYRHEGAEGGYLLKGELTVEIEDAIYQLQAGESITFRSDFMHRISNMGESTAEAIWVNSIPWIFSTR